MATSISNVNNKTIFDLNSRFLCPNLFCLQHFLFCHIQLNLCEDQDVFVENDNSTTPE